MDNDTWKVEILKALLKHEKKVHEAIDFLRSIQKEILKQFEAT
jgi:NADPH-dependent glutamate synthase beta subunit-like oxidoreductase